MNLILFNTIVAITGSGIAGIAAIVVILAYIKSDRVVVRQPKNKGSFVEGVYWTIPKHDKRTGNITWDSVFWQRSLSIPSPPEEAIDISKKGKKFVEVYRMSEDEFIFINDSGLLPGTKLSKNGRTVTSSFKAFTPVQREVIVSQFEKAKAENPDSWLKINGMNIAMASMMMIIIVVGLVYAGEILGGIADANGAATGTLQELNKLVRSMGFGEVAQEVVVTNQDLSGNTIIVEGSETQPTE